MRITKEQMESRMRILNVRSALTEAVAKTTSYCTTAEVVVALTETLSFWTDALLRDEQSSEPSGEEEAQG